MVKELSRGWTPERAEELQLQDFVERAAQNASQVPGKRPCDEPMKHYLYFPKKSNAEEAGERLRSQGFSVEVSKNAVKENWLVLASKAPPKTGEEMDELRNGMEGLAVQFSGDYDGWEARVESLGSESVAKGQRAN